MSRPLIRSDSLSLVTLLTHSVAQSLNFYVGQLDFQLKTDETIKGERFLVIAPANLTEFTPQCNIRIKQAVTDWDKAAVGLQGGSGFWIQIECEDFEGTYEKLRSVGAQFVGAHPRQEDDYRAVTVVDNCGNRVNVVERRTLTMGRVFTRDVGY
jgi:hypothetical protein